MQRDTADKIDKIPTEARWELATKGLTGAYSAISKALEDAIGEEKFAQFNGSLWHEAGKDAKGHVFNLGHGITPPTPISAVEALVETVQNFRR